MPKADKTQVAALERSPSHLLHRALQLALDVYAAEAGEEGPTQRQFAVLAAVEAHPRPTQTDLVRATGVDRSTLADMVARMTAKGLLTRVRSDADARANEVRLTEAGQAMLEAARPRAAAADARILSLLGGPGKRDAFVTALRALSRAGEAGLELSEAPPASDKPRKPKKAKADKGRGEKGEKKKKKRRARQADGLTNGKADGRLDGALAPPAEEGAA